MESIETPDADVVLLVDTFNRYFEPENARAAVKVLEASGRRVPRAGRLVLRPHVPFRRHGRRSEARSGEDAGRARAVRRARRADRRARAVVPVLAARRVPGNGLRRAGGRGACCSRSILARDPGRLKLHEIEKRVLVHGHCHQKAFDAMPAVEKVLRLIPGVEPSVIETSCCGMAGSFGYEAEHYDVSMKMAELALLARGEEGRRCAGGCRRHQLPPPDRSTARGAKRCTSRACSSSPSRETIRAAGCGRRRGTCRRRGASAR